MQVLHAYTLTQADATATSVVRPSDWNSGHNLAYNLSGNTAGSSQVSGTNVVFVGGNNVTISADTANSRLAFSAANQTQQPMAFSAGGASTTANTLPFANSNGISFGLNAGSITASYTVPTQSVQPVAYSAANGSAAFSTLPFANSNGVSFSTGTQGLYATVKTDYLTTAALSDHSHGNPSLALTNLSGTTASNSAGLTLSLSAAAQSAQPVAYSAANGSAAFSTLPFANSNGVSFSTGTQGLYATVRTDYQSAGAYLTTARASNDAIGLNTALTGNGVAWTVNSSGISLSVPAFLTTAALSNHSHGNPTLALTNLSGTTASASNGLTLSLSAAAQSAQPVAYSAANGSAAFSTLAFANSNGVSFSTGTQGLFATVRTDYQSAGAYLTTARASNDAIGLNTALTGNGVAWTVNSSGLSLNIPAFLTTAALSNHSHGNPSLALTNLSGTTASNSAGLTLSISAAAQSVQPVAYSAANGSAAFSTLTFANSNGVSFSTGTQGVYATVKTDYLTTARASNDAIGLNTALTGNGVAWTVNSGGLSLNVPAFLTTAALSNHSHGNPTLNLTNLSGTTASNSAGLTLSLSAAAQSVQPVAYSAANGSAAFNTLTFANSNGVSFSTGTQGLFATVRTDYQSAGAYLTTARASNDAIGLNTAASNVTWTANSAGISINANGYAGTGTTFNGHQINGSITLNSDGLNLSLSAFGGGGNADGYNILAAGTQTAGTAATVEFVNSNGISFGMSNSSQITASYTVPIQTAQTLGIYIGGNTTGESSSSTFDARSLTFGAVGPVSMGMSAPGFVVMSVDAALSNHSHGNPTLALTNLSGTTASASNGVTFSLSAAAQSVQPVAYSAANGSAAFSTLTFANSNGVSFSTGTQGLFATVKTDYLTTARASNDAVGLGTALTAGPLAWTVNSNGISLNAGSAAGTSSGFGGNLISASMTHNTAGLNLSLNHPAWLTTAAQSSVSNVSVVYAGTASNGGTATLSGGVSFSNANGISFYTSAGNAIVATVRTDYLTTAALSNHSHGNPTLALTNINGTTASASNGLTLSLSAVVPAQTVQPVAASGSNGSFAFSTLSFGALNGLTFYTSNGSIVGSYTDAGAGGGVNFSAGTTSAALAAVTFGNGGNVSFGLDAGVITASAPSGGGGASTLSTYIPYWPASTSSQTNGAKGVTTASAFVFPVSIEHQVNFNELRMVFSNSHATSSVAGSATVWSQFGIYSLNGSTLSQISSGSLSILVSNSSGSCTYNFPTATGTAGYTYNTLSATASAQAQSLFGSAGNRLIGLQFGGTMSLPPGQYWIGVHQRQSTTSANIGMSSGFVGNAINGITNAFLMGSSTAALATNTKYNQGWGFFTSTGLAGHSGTNLPGTMALSGISMAVPVIPLMTFISTV